MKPDWRIRRDPEQQPVRFLAGLWQQRTGTQLSPMQLGKLKSLREFLGDLTRDVIDWMVDATNWWHFCQQVRAESGLRLLPPDPHIGFLLKHHRIGVKLMRRRLHNAGAAVEFIQKLDALRYSQLKALVLVYADGSPERLAEIEAAETLSDMQRVFIDMVDGSTAA